MRVVIPPVIVGDRICRIVSPVESLLEVEEWTGEWWEPSGIALSVASAAPHAPEDILNAQCVPAEDRVGHDDGGTQPDIEALIRIRDPERPANMRFDEEVVVRAMPTRRRKYPGNARFRRSTSGPDAPPLDPERRKQKKSDPDGPRRRASDHPPRTQSDGTA